MPDWALLLLDQALASLLGWEGVAVVLALAYLLLAGRENPWCWWAGFGSTLIYLHIFWDARLYLESVLQWFYLGISVYGWWLWTRKDAAGRLLPIGSRPWPWHLRAIGVVLALSLVSGALMDRYTDAAAPFVDAFVTWGSVLTTWMVTRKLIENWPYWLVIDSVAMVLYWQRGLFLTSLLFAVYLVLVLIGWRRWTQLREQRIAV